MLQGSAADHQDASHHLLPLPARQPTELCPSIAALHPLCPTAPARRQGSELSDFAPANLSVGVLHELRHELRSLQYMQQQVQTGLRTILEADEAKSVDDL